MNARFEERRPEAPVREKVREPIPGVVYPSAEECDAYVRAGVLGSITLPEAFRESFARHAGRPAIVGSGADISFGELDERSERLAAALLTVGLHPQDRVIFQLPNGPDLIVCFVACLKAGLIPVCTLQAHRELEIGYLAAHSGARAHIVLGQGERFDDVAFAVSMRSRVPSLRYIVKARGGSAPGVLALGELVAAMPLKQAREINLAVKHDPSQAAVFQLSGGTTGVPKIIPRFHNEYLHNMQAVARWNRYTEEEVLFLPTPLMHNLHMACHFGPMLLVGGATVVVPDLKPMTILRALRKHQPTWLGLPAVVAAKLAWPLRLGLLRLKRARAIICPNGAPQVSALMKVPAFHIFGMSEGVVMLTRPQDPQLVRDIAVGRPVCAMDQVRIVVPGTDHDVPQGEVGEALFKGAYTTRGYFDAAERNAEAFGPGGFYRSGDLMREMIIAGVSYYVYEGRIKDVVDRGGEKISCEEVERALLGHPAIAGVAVVGVPDRQYGQKACAFIVPRPFRQVPEVAQLGVYLKEYGMAKFKWPEHVRASQALPLTKAGKLDKAALALSFEAQKR